MAHKEIGYSGREYGLVSTFAAVAMGSEWIERHVTLNHNMWGSDHLSSLEPAGLFKLVKVLETLKKYGASSRPKSIITGEKSKRESLRK